MNKFYKMTRGDTKTFEVSIKENDQLVEVSEMYFTIKSSPEITNYIFQKRIDNGIINNNNVYTITIDPEDTDDLQYGRYAYDIEIIIDNVKSTISKGYLIIDDEVTFASNETESEVSTLSLDDEDDSIPVAE